MVDGQMEMYDNNSDSIKQGRAPILELLQFGETHELRVFLHACARDVFDLPSFPRFFFLFLRRGPECAPHVADAKSNLLFSPFYFY
jgi:hypothetical protein